MTKSAKAFVGVTAALIALIGATTLSSVALYYAVYYVLSVREADELAIEGNRAAAAGDYDGAIAKYSVALQKPVGNQQKALLFTSRGHAYNSKRQFVDAIADHTEAIRLNPQLSYAFAARGYAYVERGELDKGFVDFTEAIRLDPNSDSAYYNRGLLLSRRGQFSDALMDFDEAVRCSPERADRLVARGLCYFAMDDFDRALASFDGGIAAEPGNAIGYLARSNFYARRGNVDRQQRDFQQALSLNPNAGKLWMQVDKWFANKHTFDNLSLLSSSDAHLSPQQLLSRNAGKTYDQIFQEAKLAHDQGNYEDEIALWNAVVAMSPSPRLTASALMNRGNAYEVKGDLDQALQDYNEAIQFDPGNAGAYVDRALTLARRQDVEGAMKDYAKAISLNPQQWQAYFNRAAELKDHGKLREALADLNEVIKLNPGFAGAYVNRANIYVRQDQVLDALRDCTTALELDPNTVQAYAVRANLLSRKRNYAGALSDLQTAVRLKSKKPESELNSLAWFRATCPEAQMRDGKEAVQLATKACELSQWKNWSHIDTLAAAYAEAGNFEEAIKYQTQAVETAKASPDVGKITQHLGLYQQHEAYREEPN